MVPVIGAVLVGAALYLGARAWAGAAAEANSRREDAPETEEADVSDDEIAALVDSSLGWPYWYGKGGPSTPWSDGPDGVDCSGYVQMALVRLGLLPADGPRRRATSDSGAILSLANICDPVAVGDEAPGDLAIYPGHVMLVVGETGADGHAAVCGASGGDAETEGNDPNARVKLFASALYRADFVTYGRIKPSYRA